MQYRISDKIRDVRGSIIRELFKLTNDPKMIAFGGGNPSPDSFPVEEIRKIACDILDKDPVSMLKYGLTEGYAPLRETMKSRLTRTEDMNFEKNDLFIVSGGQQCADLTAKIFLNEGDVVITEEPAFVSCLNAFRSYGARLVGIPMKPDGMDIERLEQALMQEDRARLIYTIPSFQNPTGFTTSEEKRKELYRLAQKHDVMIFEDNPYGELRFTGNAVPTIKSIDSDGRVTYAGSFSKTMAPAFRLGFLVVDKSLATRFSIAKQCTDTHSNTLFQYICDEYMKRYDYERHISETREIYRRKCDLMLSEMEKHFHPAVRFNRPEGGLFVMAFLPEGSDSFPFVEEGIKRGVACVPGVAFAVDQDRPANGIRLNYSTSSDEQIQRGIKILGELTYEWMRK